jgi:CubicO group peptidase (beta-lactamase class C family)
MKLLPNMKSIALYVLTILIILALFHSYVTASVNTYASNGWKVSTPEMQGMHSPMLADMMEYIKKNNFNIDSLLILRNGHMIFDAYFYPFSIEQKHHIYSCTKSIMSALIGIAINKGYIQNVK